jgi:hypothetical protein
MEIHEPNEGLQLGKSPNQGSFHLYQPLMNEWDLDVAFGNPALSSIIPSGN